MPGWVRFNQEDIKDLCSVADFGSVRNTETPVSEILGKIDSWSHGNPNSRIFVPLPEDQDLAWLSFCAVMQSFSGRSEEILYYSSGSDDATSPAVKGRAVFIMARGLSGYDHFGMFAEMPDWTEEVAKTIEDRGPLIIFYPSVSNGNRMTASANEAVHKARDTYLRAGLMCLASSLILLLFYHLNIGVEIALTNYSLISIFPIISIILFVSSLIFLVLGSRNSGKGVLKYAGSSALLFFLGIFGLIAVVVVLSFLISGTIDPILTQVLISRIIFMLLHILVFLSVFIYIIPILRSDLHGRLYEFSALIISLYVLLGVIFPSRYVEIAAPPYYLIIGYYPPAYQFTATVSLITVAFLLITIALALYTLFRFPVLGIMKPGSQNLSDNVAHD
ncbi:MAG: hypothetical protein ACYCT2_06485 [Thermoplasmataceae archaeon]